MFLKDIEKYKNGAMHQKHIFIFWSFLENFSNRKILKNNKMECEQPKCGEKKMLKLGHERMFLTILLKAIFVLHYNKILTKTYA